VEQCDAALSLFGIPKTGIFGLLDLIGLDLMPHVLNNFKQVLDPEDRLHNITEVPNKSWRIFTQHIAFTQTNIGKITHCLK
jgi:3-hydroxyacyl-CoA dehydrogenase